MAKDVNTACKCVLSAIEETDAILPIYENVSDAKERFGNYDMANNVFWNAVSACNRLFQIENAQDPLSLTGRIAKLISKYDCSEIYLELFSLKNANLQGAYLFCADLTRADLTRAYLTDADLRSAVLIRANLSNAYLTRAYLIHTYLRSAVLTRADLRGADLIDVSLVGADFENAKVSRSQYDYISKQDVENLDKIIVVDDE